MDSERRRIGTVDKHRRIVIAKIGLDGHQAGGKLISVILREAGYEVIYLGMRQTVKSVVTTALHEDADLIGISLLSGVHLEIGADLIQELERSALTIPVIFGGIIPPQDITTLLEIGVAAVFGPGSTRKEIVASVDAILSQDGAPDAKYMTSAKDLATVREDS